MLISGEKSRSIFPQNTANWGIGFSQLPQTGCFSLFFSGSNFGFEAFYIKNGKIFPESGSNELLAGYNYGENLYFSGNIGKNTIDLYNDRVPLYLQKLRPTGNINKIIINTFNDQVNFENFILYGAFPNIVVGGNNQSYSTPFFTFYSGEILSYPIYNDSNFELNILSGTTSNNNFAINGADNILLPPKTSGYIYIENIAGAPIESNQNIPITLYTNAGEKQSIINVSGVVIVNGDSYLNFGPGIDTIINNTENSYTIVFKSPTGVNIDVSLKYISGFTGKYYVNKNLDKNITGYTITSNITGSSYIVKTITGLVSGFNTNLNAYEYGTGYGQVSGLFTAKNQATTGIYSVLSTGIGYASGFSSAILIGSNPNLFYTGYISYTGGILTANSSGAGTGILNGQSVTGYISQGQSQIYSPYTGEIIGNFNNTEYEEIDLQYGPLFVTGNFKTLIDITGYTLATGGLKSGKLIGDFGTIFEPGSYTFSIPYSGAVTGKTNIFSGFDPVANLRFESVSTTGLINTTIKENYDCLGCNFDIKQNINITGIPNEVFVLNGQDKAAFNNIDYFLQLPINSGKEYIYENSNFQLKSGGFIVYSGYNGFAITGGRTRISRLGATSSGSGIFDNVFQKPFFDGNGYEIESGYIVRRWSENFHGWKESLPTIYSTGYISGISPYIESISGQIINYNESDYGVIQFSVTGLPVSGSNFSDIISLNFQSSSPGDMMVFNLYSITGTGAFLNPSGFPYQIQFTGNNILEIPNTGYIEIYNPNFPFGMFYGDNFYSPILTTSGGYYKDQNFPSSLNSNIKINNTGNYIGIIKSVTINPKPVYSSIGLLSGHFNGCESNGFFSFAVKRDGFYDYAVDLTAKLVFDKAYLPTTISKDIIENGYNWKLRMNSGENSAIFTLPVRNSTELNVIRGQNSGEFLPIFTKGSIELQIDQNSIDIDSSLYLPVEKIIYNSQPSATFEIQDDDGASCVYPTTVGVATNNIPKQNCITYIEEYIKNEIFPKITEENLPNNYEDAIRYYYLAQHSLKQSKSLQEIDNDFLQFLIELTNGGLVLESKKLQMMYQDCYYYCNNSEDSFNYFSPISYGGFNGSLGGFLGGGSTGGVSTPVNLCDINIVSNEYSFYVSNEQTGESTSSIRRSKTVYENTPASETTIAFTLKWLPGDNENISDGFNNIVVENLLSPDDTDSIGYRVTVQEFSMGQYYLRVEYFTNTGSYISNYYDANFKKGQLVSFILKRKPKQAIFSLFSSGGSEYVSDIIIQDTLYKVKFGSGKTPFTIGGENNGFSGNINCVSISNMADVTGVCCYGILGCSVTTIGECESIGGIFNPTGGGEQECGDVQFQQGAAGYQFYLPSCGGTPADLGGDGGGAKKATTKKKSTGANTNEPPTIPSPPTPNFSENNCPSGWTNDGSMLKCDPDLEEQESKTFPVKEPLSGKITTVSCLRCKQKKPKPPAVRITLEHASGMARSVLVGAGLVEPRINGSDTFDEICFDRENYAASVRYRDGVIVGILATITVEDFGALDPEWSYIHVSSPQEKNVAPKNSKIKLQFNEDNRLSPDKRTITAIAWVSNYTVQQGNLPSKVPLEFNFSGMRGKKGAKIDDFTINAVFEGPVICFDCIDNKQVPPPGKRYFAVQFGDPKKPNYYSWTEDQSDNINYVSVELPPSIGSTNIRTFSTMSNTVLESATSVEAFGKVVNWPEKTGKISVFTTVSSRIISRKFTTLSYIEQEILTKDGKPFPADGNRVIRANTVQSCRAGAATAKCGTGGVNSCIFCKEYAYEYKVTYKTSNKELTYKCFACSYTSAGKPTNCNGATVNQALQTLTRGEAQELTGFINW